MTHAGEGSLGEELRVLRTARRLGLNEAARRSGVSQGALSAWESGNRRPRGPALVRLLDALDADERTTARLLRLADPAHARLTLATSPFDPVDVGLVLRALRERRGVTQAELARGVGVSQVAVSKWETGDARPSAETIHAVGFALGATAEETVALASAAGWGGGGLPERPEDASAWMMRNCGPYVLQEVVFLGWEAELGRRAARDARWDPALVLAIAKRAAWLGEEERYAEIAPLAHRAIRLATTPETRFHAAPAIAALADADRHLGRGHARAVELAGEWAASLPDSDHRAWMMCQCGMSLLRMGRVAQGVELVAESGEMDGRALGDATRWSLRVAMLCEAYLEAGEPRRAADLLAGRWNRNFDPRILVRVEHANGRAATESEMAWLRHWAATREPSTPLKRRRYAEIERRQTWFTGERPSPDEPGTDDPGVEDRLWTAVLRDRGIPIE